jgi:hypothetical protein
MPVTCQQVGSDMPVACQTTIWQAARQPNGRCERTFGQRGSANGRSEPAVRTVVLVSRCERVCQTGSGCERECVMCGAIVCSSQPVRTSVQASVGSERTFRSRSYERTFCSRGYRRAWIRVDSGSRVAQISSRVGSPHDSLDVVCTICYDDAGRP